MLSELFMDMLSYNGDGGAAHSWKNVTGGQFQQSLWKTTRMLKYDMFGETCCFIFNPIILNQFDWRSSTQDLHHVLFKLCKDTIYSLLYRLCDLDTTMMSPLCSPQLDQFSTGVSGRPQSQAVSSFMDLLKASNPSTPQEDAVHLLVDAMDSKSAELYSVV